MIHLEFVGFMLLPAIAEAFDAAGIDRCVSEGCETSCGKDAVQ